jgi:hypothetical protein
MGGHRRSQGLRQRLRQLAPAADLQQPAIASFTRRCAIVTAFFAFQLRGLQVGRVDKMLPQGHPAIKNYIDNRESWRVGDSVRVVIEAKGDIFDRVGDPGKINDDLHLAGRDRLTG